MFKIGTLVWVRAPQKVKKTKAKQGEKRWEKRATIHKVSSQFPGHYKIKWVDDGFLQKEKASSISSRLYTVNELLSVNPEDTIFIESPDDYIKGLKEGDLDFEKQKQTVNETSEIETDSDTEVDNSSNSSDEDEKDWETVLREKVQVSHDLEDHCFGYLDTHSAQNTDTEPPKFTEFPPETPKTHPLPKTTSKVQAKPPQRKKKPSTKATAIQVEPSIDENKPNPEENHQKTSKWAPAIEGSKRARKPNKKYLE